MPLWAKAAPAPSSLLLLLALLGAGQAAAGSGDSARAERLDVEQQVYPLISDFDANGVRECVLLTNSTRVARGHKQVGARVDLVEAMAPESGRGFPFKGYRYRFVPGGRFQLDGILLSFPGAGNRDVKGARQTRFGMLSLVLLPAKDQATGRSLNVALYNTDRGHFEVMLDELAFATVEAEPARRFFARIAAGEEVAGTLGASATRSPERSRGRARARPGPSESE
jgi:hypothetical protein